MNISLELLLLLDAIDRRGSFAAAAHSLHRVPSALTHAIGKAESQFGFALFERVGRRAVLTEAGRSLLDGGRPLLEAATQLERRARQVASGWEAELRIAVDALIPAERLFPLIEAFYAAGHTTEIRLSNEVLAGCWDALLGGRADLAIGAPGDMPAGGGIHSETLGSIEFVFAIAPDHPLASEAEPLPSAQIRRYRAVVLADTTRALTARSAGLLSGQATLVVATVESKVAAQVAGLGVGYLPRALAEQEAARGRVVIRETAEPRLPTQLHLAWCSSHRGQALAWFTQRLREAETRVALLP
ncbi:MAG: LysR family transcriptional regulator [Rhodocyclaceae bacterium]